MGSHTPLHVYNLFLNPHDDTMFYWWCDFFFSLILKIMLFMSYADMHTHSEEQVNEIDLRVCLCRRLTTKTRWSSASSVFISSCLFCLAHLICWLHRCFITRQKIIIQLSLSLSVQLWRHFVIELLGHTNRDDFTPCGRTSWWIPQTAF